MRRKFVAANWKMNGSRARNRQLLDALKPPLQSLEGRVDIAVCPSHLHLGETVSALAGSLIRPGAQDLFGLEDGAMTGEVSASMLVDCGAEFVIVGHSERRGHLGETDAAVAAKFAAAKKAGLTPILCVGETRAERDAGNTEAVVLRQLDAVTGGQGVEAMVNAAVNVMDGAVIAYEPVWAIGSGTPATPEQAQAVHALLRARLREQSGAVADGVRILYGGSMNAANARELFAQPDIDGGLVGGASLKAEEFTAICASAVS